MRLLIRQARLAEGATATADVALDGGRVLAASSRLGRSDLRGWVPEVILEGAGALLLPGLHDHHIHLRAAAVASSSLRLGPPQVTTREEMASALRRQAETASSGEDTTWIRGVGYHESVAGLPVRGELDQLVSDRPVRIQHRSGALWLLNSRAVARLRLDDVGLPGVERDRAGQPTGRLFRMDDWLARRLREPPPDLGSVSRSAAAVGVTGFTEAGAGLTRADAAWFATQVESGRLTQRLHLMSSLETAGRSRVPADPAAGGGRTPAISPGPVKLLLDDTTLPGLEELVRQFRDAHRSGLPVAVHCVTRVQLFLTLAALQEAGPLPGDRIEHGSVIPDEALAGIARTGAAVVTNPGFILDRGDRYLEDVEAEDRPHLYRARSLLEAGIAVAAGTDAPFGDPDPWACIRAAVTRTTSSGRPLGPREALSPARAVALFLRHWADLGLTRMVASGQPADLFLLGTPLAEAVAGPGPPAVTATLAGGMLIHQT